jgi:1,4-alpha-glucan branching enzyme
VRPKFTGLAPNNTRVVVDILDKDSATVASVSTDTKADGSWELELPANLSAGVYTPVIKVKDAAGNET